jgi:hypothetical protein
MATLEELIAGTPPANQQAAGINADNVLNGNAAGAAKALELSRKSGLPASTIASDPPAFDKDFLQTMNAGIINSNDHIAKFTADNPVAASAMQNDFEKMDAFSKPWAALTSGFTRGRLASEYGHAGAAFGAGIGSEEDVEKARARVQAIPEAPGALSHLQGVGSFAGGLMQEVAKSWATTGLGGAGFAAAGLPAAAGTAVLTGLASSQAVSSYGSLYADLKKQGILEWQAQGAALMFGGLAGGLNFLGFRGATQSIAQALLRDGAAQAVKNETFGQIVGAAAQDTLKGGVTGSAMMGGIQAAQEVLTDLAKTASPGEWETIFNDPKRRQEAVDAVNHAMVEGAIGVGALHGITHAPAVGRSAFADASRVWRANKDAALLDEAGRHADSIGTKEGLEAFARSIQGDQQVGVPLDRLTPVMEANPEFFQRFPELQRQITEAQSSGSDVHLPLSQLITEPKVLSALRDDVRVRPEGLTVNEAKDLESSPPAYERPTTVEGERSPEAQGVVEATAKARHNNWLDPLLRPESENKPPIGMTEIEYRRYSQKLEQLQAAVERRAEALAEREVAKRLTPAWKRNEKEIESEARNDLSYRPDLHVDAYLREGQLAGRDDPPEARVKLDAGAVEAILGSTDQLPRGTAARKGGLHPDDLAQMFGYNSGQKLLEDLMSLHRQRQLEGLTPKGFFDRLVGEETARRMEERYGKLDENIQREAQEAVVQRAQTEVLGAELEHLGDRSGNLPIDTRAVEAHAHQLFATMPLARALDTTAMLRLVGRAGRAAELALLAGKTEDAFLAKQRQFIAHIMARGSAQLAKDYAGFERLTRRFRDATVPTVEQAYTDQIHGVMRQLDLPVRRDEGELTRALEGKSLGQFMERKLADGRDMPVAALLTDFATPYPALREGTGRPAMTTEEFHALNDSLKTLAHNGREEKRIRVGEKREALEELTDRALASVYQDRTLKTQPFELNPWDETKMLGRKIDAALLRAEQLFQWLDNNDPTGVFSGIFQNFSKAKYQVHDMMTELGGKLKELAGSKEFKNGLDRYLENDRLVDWNTDDLLRLNGKHLLAMMLHLGSESNVRKLTSKFEWNGEQHGFDLADVEHFVNRHATKEHWDLVQGIWKINEEYFWPKIDEHARRLSGIGLEKIEPRTIDTPFGPVKGGYAVVDADARWPHATGDVKEGMFAQNRWRNAIPSRSYTMSRTQAAYPINLQFENVLNSMRESIHDLAYREPLLDAANFFSQRSIKEGIQRSFGKEYYDSIPEWLNSIAGVKLVDPKTLDGLSRVANFVRQRLVLTELVGRMSTLGKHSFAALGDSIAEMNTLLESPVKQAMAPLYFFKEALEVYGNVPDAPAKIKDILSRSGELRSRWHGWDRDLNELAQRSLLGDVNPRERAALLMSYPIAGFDMASAIPIYTFAEKHFLEKGFSPEEASIKADVIVRNAHGSAGVADLPAVLKGPETLKAFTVAYNFFNHSYNRIRNIGREAVAGTKSLSEGELGEAFGHYSKAAWLSLWYIFIIGVGEHFITHSGPDENKDESVGAWAAKGAAHQVVGTLPLGRDIGMPLLSLLDGKRVEPTTPIGQFGRVMTDLGRDAGKIASGEELSGNWWQHFARGVGYGAGIPGMGQVASTGQFLWDLDSGRQYADDTPSMIRGLALGKSHPHERTPR